MSCITGLFSSCGPGAMLPVTQPRVPYGVWRPGSSIRHGRMTVVFFTGDRLSETKNDSFIRSREYYLWHQHHYPEAPEKHLVKNTVRRDGFSSFLWWFLSL